MTTGEGVRIDARFDVRQYARTARGNHRDSLQLEEFAETPLSPKTLQLIRYLARLESATMEHLRNLLVTATHKDARVTAFLVSWAFEKFWIADALDAVLEANSVGKAREVEEGKPRHAFAESSERRGPIRRAVEAFGYGASVVGVHTTTGLIDDWVMADAYVQTSATGNSKALTAVIDLILDVKRRHTEFFLDESRRRLAESPRTVKQARQALPKIVWPIGAVDRASEDRDLFDSVVFGGKEGLERVAEIANRVAGLPGMDARIGAAVAARLTPATTSSGALPA
jgi:hypothetical protein